MKGTILIIEDDDYIAELIEFNLAKEGYEVILAKDANEGLMFLKSSDIDLILLDLMLPGLQGEEFLDLIKGKGKSDLPVLIITAKTGDELFVKLLKTGADDFLVKPFSVKVLIAKIEAILRRVKGGGFNIIEAFGIEIQPDEFIARVDGEELELTKTEFDILKLLIENKGKVLTRDRILQTVWGIDASVSDRTIDVHVSKIRRKLKDKGKLIKSIPKIGYKLSL
ncbi:response regulator transcription factor [Hippea alviniae]|uniref:response regulator transcription factor n=1 Tax=Hippea alviniae TaxID=1279027 RepID=UPI0003B78523|nr:response regulator transcription factor [Hippea alviniae]